MSDNSERRMEIAKYYGMIVLLNDMYARGKVSKDEYEDTFEKILKEAEDKSLPLGDVLSRIGRLK